MSLPADTERLAFLERDNAHLLREIEILRTQVDTLRQRNRGLEQLLEQRAANQQVVNHGANTSAGPTTMMMTDPGSPRVGMGLVGPLPRTPVKPRAGMGSPTFARPGLGDGASTLISSAVSSPAPPIRPRDADFDTQTATGSDEMQAPLVLRLPRVASASVPDVSECLAAPSVGLVSATKCRTPEAVSSFLNHLTRTRHPTHKTFRAAFEAAFDVMRDLLAGCPADWRNAMDAALPPFPPPPGSSVAPSSPTSPTTDGVDIRMRTMSSPSAPTRASAEQLQLAWSVLLALSVAALGDRAAAPLSKLPWTIKIQVVSLIPASLHRHSVLEFKIQTVEEVVRDYWSCKRTILSMKHGWTE